MARNARRTRVGGVRDHVWAPQTKVCRPDRLARYMARRSRAPYLRRWALIIALGEVDDEGGVVGGPPVPPGVACSGESRQQVRVHESLRLLMEDVAPRVAHLG